MSLAITHDLRRILNVAVKHACHIYSIWTTPRFLLNENREIIKSDVIWASEKAKEQYEELQTLISYYNKELARCNHEYQAARRQEAERYNSQHRPEEPSHNTYDRKGSQASYFCEGDKECG